MLLIFFIISCLISSLESKIFRDEIDFCDDVFCGKDRPICANEFGGEFADDGRRCISPENIDRRGQVTYKFVTRTKYLVLPFAITYKYLSNEDVWVRVKSFWKRRGRAIVISQSHLTKGHLFLIRSTTSTRVYLFKFKGEDAIPTPQTTKAISLTTLPQTTIAPTTVRQTTTEAPTSLLSTTVRRSTTAPTSLSLSTIRQTTTAPTSLLSTTVPPTSVSLTTASTVLPAALSGVLSMMIGIVAGVLSHRFYILREIRVGGVNSAYYDLNMSRVDFSCRESTV